MMHDSVKVASQKLRQLDEQKQLQKRLADKVGHVSKQINELLKTAAGENNLCEKLSSLLNDVIAKTAFCLEQKNQYLVSKEGDLINEKEKLGREKLKVFEQKEKLQASISNIKDTILKINRTIDESVREETSKNEKIEADLDKSILEIKEKITIFNEEAAALQQENEEMAKKKEDLLRQIGGLEDEYKKKDQQKDDSTKECKDQLMSDLKRVEQEMAEVTELNNRHSQLEKKNMNGKMSIYMKTKKFPEYASSFESSANVINQCKNELFKGVHRIRQANQSLEVNEAKHKQLNQKFLAKLKVLTEKQEQIAKYKTEKEMIRARIIDLQRQKKEKQMQTE